MTYRPITCPVCSGARTLETRADEPPPCPECDGSGWVMMMMSDDEVHDDERLVSPRQEDDGDRPQVDVR